MSRKKRGQNRGKSANSANYEREIQPEKTGGGMGDAITQWFMEWCILEK